jgi:hypothetical protein
VSAAKRREDPARRPDQESHLSIRERLSALTLNQIDERERLGRCY